MHNTEVFLEFAESLKLVRKAELEIDGVSKIDDIYTDLLPNNGIINKINLPRTTIITGRKGTGKSTIFHKSQKDIDLNKQNLSIYIDVKSLVDNAVPNFPTHLEDVYESQELKKYLLYSNLIQEILIKTKEKLKTRFKSKFSFSSLVSNTSVLDNVNFELDEIEKNIGNVFKKLNTTLITSYRHSQTCEIGNQGGVSMDLGLENIAIKANTARENKNSIKKEFDDTLLTYLDIKSCFIANLLRIKALTKAKYLYIYLDDFSEIEKKAQVLFMDWFIAPVNNLSEDFVKFKIATYPKRFYYGKLDSGKIDEISLDFFDAFYSYEKKSDIIDISRMEHLALDYTKRLLNNRFEVYFPNKDWHIFFDIKPDKLYETLFDVSLNTPRKIGYILSFCYESCLIHKTPITKSAIEKATLRYYNDVIEKYFLVNEHICRPFDDKITNAHQYDLIMQIVNRQSENKTILRRRKYKGTSHFYIHNKLSYLLDNLELNGFITTYNKVKSDNNIFSTLYALDYGLCEKFQLCYSHPKNKNLEKVHLQPIFNFNSLIMDYFNNTQVILCEKGHEFPYAQYSEFQKFKMTCPTCIDSSVISKCEVSIKFKELKDQFAEQGDKEKINISFQEFLVLDFMKISQNSISHLRLIESLDISKTSIEQIIKRLIDKECCEHDIEASKKLNKELVKITIKGVNLVEKVHSVIEKLKIKVDLD